MCAEKENVDEMRQKSRKDTEKDWRPTIEQCEKNIEDIGSGKIRVNQRETKVY